MVKLFLLCLALVTISYAQKKEAVTITAIDTPSYYVSATPLTDYSNQFDTYKGSLSLRDAPEITQAEGFYISGSPDQIVFESIKSPGQYISCPNNICDLSSTPQTFVQSAVPNFGDPDVFFFAAKDGKVWSSDHGDIIILEENDSLVHHLFEVKPYPLPL